MTRIHRAVWSVALVVTLVAFGLAIPRLPAWGDTAIRLDADTAASMATASVVIPAGWELDIASAAQSVPVATREGVEVTATDALWFGKTSDLLLNVARLLFDGEAVIPLEAVTSEPDRDGDSQREVWRLVPTAAADPLAPVRVEVIREGQGVVLLITRHIASDPDPLWDQVDAIADSVELDLPTLDVEVQA